MADVSARRRAVTKTLYDARANLDKLEAKFSTSQNPADAERYRKQQLQLEAIEKKVKELEALEARMSRVGGGGGGGGGGEADAAVSAMEAKLLKLEEEMRKREEKIAKLGNMDSLFEKLEKLNQLENLMAKVDRMEKMGVGGGGGGGSGQSGAELKAEIEEVQKIIFSEDPSVSDQAKAEANIRLEKLMEEYEKTPEAREEKAKAAEDKRKRNEPLNSAALVELKKIYTMDSVENDPIIKAKVQKYPDLKIIAMEPGNLLKIHENDFRNFSLASALTCQELRAIRANCPKFRRDQRVQLGWLESLENKIEEKYLQEQASGGKKAAKKPAKKLVLKKPAPGGDRGGLFAELLAKRGALAPADEGGGEGEEPEIPKNKPPPEPMKMSGGPPPPPMKMASGPPPPPMKMASGPPPPPPPGADPAAAPAKPSRRGQGREKTEEPAAPPPPPPVAAAATPPPPAAAPAKTGKLKPPATPPPKEAVQQLVQVKDSLQKLSAALKDDSDAKQVAVNTRKAVDSIMAQAKMGSAQYPAECKELEACSVQLVQVVKEVLAAKKNGTEGSVKEKFDKCVVNITQCAAKTLGYTMA